MDIKQFRKLGTISEGKHLERRLPIKRLSHDRIDMGKYQINVSLGKRIE